MRQQQGTLVQLPDGRWRARYRAGGRAGARPQRTFQSEQLARDWLDAEIAELRAFESRQQLLAPSRQRGQVTQLGDGRWRVRYRADGASGSRPQVTFDTQEAAQAFLASQRALLEARQSTRKLASLLARARVDPATGCWLWQGAAADSRGYGKVGMNGRRVHVHRAFYELFVGPIPDGFHAHHVCENPRCVNPGHLEAVSPAEHKQRHARPNPS